MAFIKKYVMNSMLLYLYLYRVRAQGYQQNLGFRKVYTLFPRDSSLNWFDFGLILQIFT